MSEEAASKISYLALTGPAKRADSNPVSRIIATEGRPQSSEVERSRGSPQNLEVELRSKKHSHPGCGFLPSGSQSAPIAGPFQRRPYTFSPSGHAHDDRSSRYDTSGAVTFGIATLSRTTFCISDSPVYSNIYVHGFAEHQFMAPRHSA